MGNLDEPCIPQSAIYCLDQPGEQVAWFMPIIKYLEKGELPEDKMEARKLKSRSGRYTLINGVLYKRGYAQPYLKCVADRDAEYILKEIHMGVCGNHSGGRALAHKVLRTGYYWPTIAKDAQSFV